MNAALKTRIANILTALAFVFATVQTFLTNPPFTAGTIAVVGAIMTYAVLLTTTWKQYLSPEVTNAGARVTLWIALAATLTGVLDMLNVIHFSAIASQYIKWGITVIVAIINILSKQIFPSDMQKDTMHDLKKVH